MSLFRTAQAERHPLLPAFLLLAYIASTAFAYALTRGTGGLAVLWINNGLLAAGLLLLPRAPAIQLAILCTLTDCLGAVLSGSLPAQALLIAACDLLEAVAIAVMLRRLGGAAQDPTVLPRFGRVLLLGFLPVTLLVATIGSALAALLFGDDFKALWPVWAGSDYLG